MSGTTHASRVKLWWCELYEAKAGSVPHPMPNRRRRLREEGGEGGWGRGEVSPSQAEAVAEPMCVCVSKAGDWGRSWERRLHLPAGGKGGWVGGGGGIRGEEVRNSSWAAGGGGL
eukprot:scaffold13840_cov92-Isochrysis_galbana.AAC.1